MWQALVGEGMQGSSRTSKGGRDTKCTERTVADKAIWQTAALRKAARKPCDNKGWRSWPVLCRCVPTGLKAALRTAAMMREQKFPEPDKFKD